MAEVDLSKVNQVELESPEDRVVLPIPQAINELAPGSRWSMVGVTYEDVRWEDDVNPKPSKEAVITRAKEILAEVPWVKLRKERDARMREVDWVTLRAMRTGEPIPKEWADYMQALADITTTTTNPVVAGGVLVNVNWPQRPDGKPTGYYRGF